MKTIYINLLGGPGLGKSTAMAGIFAQLKKKNVECEMATEFAKDLVWEERTATFADELYLLGKQNHRLFRLNGKVDVVITDSPLILICYYAKNDKDLCKVCRNEFNKYNNMNFFLTRETTYSEVGRGQTEAEAIKIDEDIKDVLKSHKIKYKEISYMTCVDTIVNEVLKALEEK